MDTRKREGNKSVLGTIQEGLAKIKKRNQDLGLDLAMNMVFMRIRNALPENGFEMTQKLMENRQHWSGLSTTSSDDVALYESLTGDVCLEELYITASPGAKDQLEQMANAWTETASTKWVSTGDHDTLIVTMKS